MPGRSTLAEHDALATPPPEAAAKEGADAAALEAPAPDAAAPAPAPAPAPEVPDGARGKYADSHRKTVRDYRIGKKKLTVSDLRGRGRGRVNERDGETQFADDQISVDIGTVVGSRSANYKNAYVLVWHTRKGADDRKAADGKALNPKKRSADPTGWIKVGKLPKKARDEIAAFQNKERKAQTRGTGPGHKAATTSLTMTLAPVNPTGITEKFVPRPAPQTPLEAFRIKGGGVDAETGTPSSTPCGNYTKNDRYGETIVGVWNPPGSTGSNGVPNTGSGGIRVFVPIGTTLQICDVAPVQVANFDTAVGTGTSTWVYVTAKINREQLYFWILRSWTFIGADGTDRSGANG